MSADDRLGREASRRWDGFCSYEQDRDEFVPKQSKHLNWKCKMGEAGSPAEAAMLSEAKSNTLQT